MSRAHSFPPVVDARGRVLILGSMPGKASLRAVEYYAHPRNLFWRFMEELFGIDRHARYEARTEALLAKHVALWDVLETCTRESSLDSDIVPDSIVPNDLPGLLAEHTGIRAICFNGAKAAQLFDRHVAPRLGAREVVLHRLPSTSPANASIPYEKKLSDWRVVADAAAGADR